MKKSFLLAVFPALILSMTACGASNYSAFKYDDYVLQSSENYIYDNVSFFDASPSGEPQSYEELQDYISIYADNVNLVRYDIIGQYSPDEAVAITGEQYFLDSTTLYRVHITYDYLNQKPLDFEAYVSKAGTGKVQIQDDPLYMVGQTYTAFLPNLYEDAWTRSIPELTFAVYEIKEEELAYHLRFEKINFTSKNGKKVGADLEETEKNVITSTKNNPVKYVKKITIEDLTNFIREDWTDRGYHFDENFQMKISDNDEGEVKSDIKE